MEMEWKRNGNGMEVLSEKKSTPDGTEKEWKWNGSFIRKKVDTRWNGNGMDMEWKWNGKNMVIHHQKNGVWKWNGMEMEMEMELTIMPMESFHGKFLSFL